MSELIEWLRRARRRTLDVFGDLRGGQLMGEAGHHLEPPLWELGHIAWFQELWILRHLDGIEPEEDQDGAFDSFHVSYRDRWDHDLPDRESMLAYADGILERCVERLDRDAPTAQERYFYRLAALHEAMHGENIALVRQALGYPRPAALPRAEAPAVGGDGWPDDGTGPEDGTGDVEIAGGTFPLGADREHAENGEAFVFDNEKWAHPVEVAPFRMAVAPVTQTEFAGFVDAGGYREREFWDKRGWQWRRQAEAEQPTAWQRRDGVWLQRCFDDWLPLGRWQPMVHVNWHEARAYCQFAGRRLPTEAEWEFAASWDPEVGRKRLFPWGDEPPDRERANLDWWYGGTVDVRALAAGDSPWGCRQMIGNVWEWTESTLTAYPGFVPDPYKEYSVPYLGHKPVLRGGAWTTDCHLIRNTWRNFYHRARRNIFAGFRTCPMG